MGKEEEEEEKQEKKEKAEEKKEEEKHQFQAMQWTNALSLDFLGVALLRRRHPP